MGLAILQSCIYAKFVTDHEVEIHFCLAKLVLMCCYLAFCSEPYYLQIFWPRKSRGYFMKPLENVRFEAELSGMM